MGIPLINLKIKGSVKYYCRVVKKHKDITDTYCIFLRFLFFTPMLLRLS